MWCLALFGAVFYEIVVAVVGVFAGGIIAEKTEFGFLSFVVGIIFTASATLAFTLFLPQLSQSLVTGWWIAFSVVSAVVAAIAYLTGFAITALIAEDLAMLEREF